MFRNFWFWPAVIAIVAWLAVVSALDPVGEFPGNGEGPGLTLDEQFNVEHGVLMVNCLLDLSSKENGKDLDAKAYVKRFRREVDRLPDHPLLGRLWLGFFHEATILFFRSSDSIAAVVSFTCARSGSAAAFAILVFLIGWYSGHWYGHRAGIVSAITVVLMPRVFGHAHLAALESCVNLTWCAAVLALADFALRNRPPQWWQTILLGSLFGLVLLTKIQGVLLPAPVGLWMLYRWRGRGVICFGFWLLTGLAVFFAGWPWLWTDPVANAAKFFGSSTNRTPISVWYFGTKFVDRDVPWHYPWVMFLTTVPLGLHALAFLGAVRSFAKRPATTDANATKPYREILLLATIAFPLILFSIPRIAVYDGERLFLMVFPLWAIFAGLGANQVAEYCQTRWQKTLPAWCLGLFLALQSYGVLALGPCHLSYYNALVGGLRGADALGLPVTYWGDSLTRTFLKQSAALVPDQSDIRFMPAMHPFQIPELQKRSISLRNRSGNLLPYNTDGNAHPPYLMLFQRNDYVPEEFHHPPVGAEMLAAVRREGVLLAALYHFPPPATKHPFPVNSQGK